MVRVVSELVFTVDSCAQAAGSRSSARACTSVLRSENSSRVVHRGHLVHWSSTAIPCKVSLSFSEMVLCLPT